MTSLPSVGTVDSLAPIWKGVGNTAAILGIVSFVLSKIPATIDNTHSVMRVCVGLNSDEVTDAGGNCPDIRLFNEIRDFIGMKPDPGYVAEGGFMDVIIDQGDMQQPTSVLVTANGGRQWQERRIPGVSSVDLARQSDLCLGRQLGASLWRALVGRDPEVFTIRMLI